MVPDTVELIDYNIPSFTLINGGKREDQIMIAYKKHVGLYPHPTTMAYFNAQLKEYKKGKGSVHFLLNKSLPTELIKQMIAHRTGSVKSFLK